MTQFYILGATGVYSDLINGMYAATMQQCGGKPVYHKCDNADIWFEYDGRAGEWNVVNTAHRGLSWGYASFKSMHDVNLCEGKPGWKVYDGKQWTDQTGVRLKIVSYKAVIAAPEVPKIPPPPPPAVASESAQSAASHHQGTTAAQLNTARASASYSDANSLRILHPRSTTTTQNQFTKDSVVRHFDFADSARLSGGPPQPGGLSKERHVSDAIKQDVSARTMTGDARSSPQSVEPTVSSSTLSSRAGQDASWSSNNAAGAVGDGSISYTQIIKTRRLHIDALEPGHPKVLTRVPKQQMLPVQSLLQEMTGLNLQAVEVSAAIVDAISVERACAKMCIWSTSRFSQSSENFIDILVASGQRMEAEEDVNLVREGEQASNVIFFVSTGQVKFVRCVR